MDDKVPPTVSDPVVEAYMVDIDRTLLQANLKLSVEDRIRQLQQFQKFVVELQRAGREAQTWKPRLPEGDIPCLSRRRSYGLTRLSRRTSVTWIERCSVRR